MEMMVVLLIVALCGSIGFSGWRHYQWRQQLNSSGSGVQALLIQLRDDANYFNREHRLRLENGCLFSESRGLVTPCADSRWQRDLGAVEAAIQGQPGFFGLRGTAWPGNITLRNQAGAYRVVISVWGRIRLCRPEGGQPC